MTSAHVFFIPSLLKLLDHLTLAAAGGVLPLSDPQKLRRIFAFGSQRHLGEGRNNRVCVCVSVTHTPPAAFVTAGPAVTSVLATLSEASGRRMSLFL